MAKAIRIHQTGGPDVLQLDELHVPEPRAGEVLVRQTAVGVNFIDIYHRSGLYKLPSYPSGLGMEAAGVVEKLGEGVNHLAPGDRVAYSGGPTGAYTDRRVLPAKFVVKLPDGISDEIAAAAMVKGLTAQYLLRHSFRIEKGHTVLIHAAAGGVGLIACQWAKYLGARVFGTVSSEEKAQLAKANGCDHPIVYTKDNFVQKIKELTAGQGVDAVYDSVGKDTFMDSLDCLKKFGTLVSFGQASGKIPPFDIALLSQKGSLFLTRPTLMHHIEDEQTYRQNAAELFDLIARKAIKIEISGRYKLENAAQAHRDLESRKTTGALVLTV